MQYKHLRKLCESLKVRNQELMEVVAKKENTINKLTVKNLKLMSDIEIYQIREGK